MKELVVEALVDNLNTVIAFIEEQLDVYGCSIKASMRIQLAVEEVFVNIASYAYEGEKGTATIQIEYLEDIESVRITLIDSGIPYNPLLRDDPDVTLEADKRPIGGLGVFMVKKTMDKVEYKYENGRNCLSITSTIE